jgi:predicted PurR-regulated permease PerM
MDQQQPQDQQRLEQCLLQLQNSMKQQELYAKRRSRYGFISMLALILAALAVLAGVLYLINTVRQLAGPVEQLSAQASAFIEELEQVRLKEMVDNVSDLSRTAANTLSQSSDGLAQMLDNINKVDFGALNASIQTLSRVVEALGSLFRIS